MSQEPYRSARRVFLVVDNGSAHRGAKGDARLRDRWPTLVPVHTPRRASWLNQIEIYFSIVQRKALTPNDFATLAALEHYLLAFQHRYQTAARTFRSTFNARGPASTPRQTREDCRAGTAGRMITKIRHRHSEMLYLATSTTPQIHRDLT